MHGLWSLEHPVSTRALVYTVCLYSVRHPCTLSHLGEAAFLTLDCVSEPWGTSATVQPWLSGPVSAFLTCSEGEGCVCAQKPHLGQQD